MGNCCTRGNDAVPEKAKRSNVDERKTNDLQPLIDTSDTTADSKIEEGEVSLERSLIVEYILNMTSFSLIDAWKSVDIDNKEEIDIEREMPAIFLHFVEDYIKKKTGNLTADSRYKPRAEALSRELAEHFQSILINYEYEGGDTIAQDFYLENLQQYLADPTPVRHEPEQSDMPSTYTLNEEEVARLTHQPIVTPASPLEFNEVFDMLSFISTSSTIKEDPNFNADHTVTLLQEALEAPKKQRGEKVGEILSQLTESQRTAVRESFVGPKDQSLQSALEDNFSGDLLLVLSELCRSSAYNDAEWIEKSRNKLNINTSVINEILMSRTNSQLAAIKQAYKERFGRDLLDSLLKSFNNTGSYGSLLKLVLTENTRILRKETNPRDLKEKKIRDDAKLLFHILETTKGKLNKLKVIEMLCHRSWFHIAILCKEYGKKSNYDLKTMIERKFGKSSKSGDALQKIIDVSRNRHSYFAELLFQSMKGMSTDDSMLIRIIVGRSGIDLGEIAAEFTQRYGNGKTLLQFIKSNARKGTYRNILLRIAAIGDDAMMEGLDEPDEDSTNMGTFSADDDMKVLESHHSISFSQSTFDGLEEKDRPRQTWEEFVSSSPTVLAKPDFNADQVAQELLAVLNDKKKKKDAKRILIQSLTRINNRQRQELKKAFQEHPVNERGQELTEATQDTLRKGKTMIVMLGLLQRPAEFNCFWVKQAIKTKKIDLLIEILVSCTNFEIKKLKDHYEKTEGSELLGDINKAMLGNKKTAQGLFRVILEGKRPEHTTPDKKLCKIHLIEMKKLLKKKNQKECKQFFAKLFVENSYSQIKYEINKFNTASDLSLVTIVKKIMGGGYSGIILEHIIKISTDRYGYFCEKLREAMKGVSTSEHILIRILIGRSEKDLGDIVQYFAEENYGEGNTLKQWFEQTLKGSFQTSLLQIAGIWEEGDEEQADLTDYESQTDSSMLSSADSNSANVYAQQPKAVKMALMPSKSAVVMTHTVPLKSKQQTPEPASSDDARSPDPTLSDFDEDEKNKPLPNNDKSPRIVISTPSQIAEETKAKKEADDAKETQNSEPYDPYDINEEEFGAFIIEKVNEKTAQRLLQHLKQGSKGKDSGDESGDDDVIGGKQCIHVLLFACVLFLKYKEKVEKRAEVKIDKKKLKASLMPSYQWIMDNKLKDNATLQKSKYKILGKWLKEYYETKQAGSQ